jgi:glutamate--cysteine ligase
MMLRTCTVQVNLDFSDEVDMVRKFRVGLALQPVAVALFANSPFYEGKPSGYLSYRSHVWTDVDPDRCGLLPFVFEPGFGFERYVDYMLDVPMYFVYRDGRYTDAAGQSFRDFMAARLPALPGATPTMSDWVDHLTTAFPEVRLKRILEMRGADAGPWAQICALPALWSGLLYDAEALDGAAALVADWTEAERDALHRDTPRLGLAAPFRGRTVRELAVAVVELARAGLMRRARLDTTGQDESHFLTTLLDIAHTGRTPAERLLERYETIWHRSVDPIYREEAY